MKKKDQKEKDKNPGGRPSKFEAIKQKLPQIYKLYEHGFTDEQVAEFIGITRETLNEYKNADKEFSDTIRTGKYIADSKVIESLFTQTQDRYIYEEIMSMEIGPDGKPTKIKEFKKIKKFVRASDNAIRIWVMNRLRNMFKDKLEISFEDIDFKKLNRQQITGLLEGGPEEVQRILADARSISQN